ncbi:nickel-dependent lactate racemase [Geodermatophilus sp. DSM 44513]|uniref:nickel-dependent lactate racemase n=1 Tax=Geodermatophilus sp. DSM 44513 TaxID=1528104 RepID=UPI001AA0EE3D|nr:nickel-dependent lactate racemase [Geodermatophilus sp. DSM 44513]WNV76919.1 nickel-dependent lactate racemase [Geodermatophilus sp. DSM 44513]
MRVRLAYGEQGLTVDLPDERTTVVEPRFVPGAPDPMAVLRTALREPVAGPPLREVVRPGQTVAISVCDGTRAQPRVLMVPAVLDELAGIVADDDVLVLVATGTHRGNTDAEIRAMLGDVVDRVRVVNHDARDDASLVWMGTHGNGVPVWLDRRWVDADVRITTGFVEPHFFAGFSGGPKLAVPGLAGLETVLTLHDAARIGSPQAVWGVCEGNPVHDDIRAVVAAVGGVHFGFDVTLNRDQQVVGAFAGELFAMHAAAREAARELAMAPVPGRFDVVVTTNSGFPLDQNLYQAVKGISAAATVVKDGGAIICAAECRDGFPDHGSYKEVLQSAESPQALLDVIENRAQTVPDQWQVQVQAKVQSRARVIMHTGHLSDEALAAAHLEQTRDIGATVRELLDAAGPDARVCVLPEGPQTIPYVAAELLADAR